MFAWALRYGCGDRAFAEDVAHDVFVSLLRAVDRLVDTDDVGGWLYRATTNACWNRLRTEAFRRSVLARVFLGASPESVDPGARVDLARNHDDALALLRALPAKERVAFCMVHVDGKSQQEVAKILGHSKGYVSKLVVRAESRVRGLGWKIDDV